MHHQSLIVGHAKNNDTSDIESIDERVREDAHQNLPSSILNKKLVLHADQKSITNKRYMPLLVINYLLLFVGSLSSSLLSKYYFNHKGSSKWVSTWVQCAGFPLLVIPICLPYIFSFTKRKPFTDFNPKVLFLSIFVGIMLGLNNLLISWGVAYLPVSTSALVLSTQLAFNLILSAIIVKQKITFSNLNCVILLTLASIILALDSSHERPTGISQKEYFIGFCCTIGAGLLFALYLPVMEKVFKKVYCYEMVMEMQLIMEFSATTLATIGMIWDGGFSEMKEESQRIFDKGSTVYWVTIMATIVTWQFCFMGTAGMVFLTSSLTGGICMTALLSMNVLGGVVVFRDAFGGLKAVSTILCIWGFCSYVYGMYIKMVEEKARMRHRNESSTELIPGGNHG
ncbi:probable purine permease 4 [Gastrolobium bilobum]|uniref:probable purine permease 4 n=1 Tax=Gastrolobium bilobum TaxID=150636 RepID=UPI002AAF28DD|nr:probable purine permease 4 [Gastrolobium bilobum]